MFLPILTAVLLVTYLTINLVKLILNNYRAHNFFRTKCPQLPTIPNPNLFIGNILQVTWLMKNCQRIDKLHNKYGNTFGFYMSSQPWVATKDLNLIKEIEINEAYKHLDRPVLGIPVDEFNSSIFQTNGDQWRQVRRVIAPTMTNIKVRANDVSSGIDQVIEQFIEAVEYKLDKAQISTNKRSIIVEAHDTSLRIALAVIFLLMYKKENTIDFKADRDSWTSQIAANEKVILNPVTMLSIAFPFLRPLATWLIQFHNIGQLNLRIVEYINKALDLHLAAKERHDKMQHRFSIETGHKEIPFSQLKSQPGFKRRMVDGVIDALLEKKITYDQYIGSLHFLLLAGFETTAATITCLLWQLSQNPDIEVKLREAIVKEGIDADYVVWCIMETVRWHPPVPLGVGRVISEDITTSDGLLIPKGSFVMPSTYSIHHDESIWPEAEKFMPERWRYSSTFHPAAFLGFGLGPRNCLGGKLAIHEVKLLLRALLTRYKIEKCEETVNEFKFSSPGLIYTIPDGPVKIRFTALCV